MLLLCLWRTKKLIKVHLFKSYVKLLKLFYTMKQMPKFFLHNKNILDVTMFFINLQAFLFSLENTNIGAIE